MENKRTGLEKVSDGIGLVIQGVVEVFSNVISAVSKVINRMDWERLAKVSGDDRIRKYYAIYRRTNKSRIKKKQVKKIKAILNGGSKNEKSKTNVANNERSRYRTRRK